MPEPSSKPHLSVFWDFENVHEDFGTHREMTKAIQEVGTIVKAYAFADWVNRRQMAKELYNLGYDVIHVPDRRDNATDYRMAAYITDHMVHYPETACYVLITGDGDFKLTAGSIRHRGLGLWVISNPIITASELTNLATKYSDVHSFRRSSLDCPDVGRCDERVRSISEMRHMMGAKLQEAVQIVKEAENKPGMGTVKYAMSSLNQDFNERDLGFHSWNDFVTWAESEGYVIREGDLPATILKLPDAYSEEMSRFSKESKDAFDLLLKVVEEGIDKGSPHSLKSLNEELQAKGLDISELGYNNLPDFVFSAETRSLIRVMPYEGEEVAVLPYCQVGRVRDWFEKNVKKLFGESVNVPKDLFLEKIRDMILENGSTLAQLEEFLQDERVVREYRAILEASDIPFLPPFQMSLAHILLGKGQSCTETVEQVNAELSPLGITINCP
ncbi:MAG: NYN domain-containing protein [Candidatus Thorarchaeota archaeon]